MFVFIHEGYMYLQSNRDTSEFKTTLHSKVNEPYITNTGELVIPLTGTPEKDINEKLEPNGKGVQVTLTKHSHKTDYVALLCNDRSIMTLTRNSIDNRESGSYDREISLEVDVRGNNHIFVTDGHEGLELDLAYGLFDGWLPWDFYEYFLSRTDVSYHDLVVIPLNKTMKSLTYDKDIRQTKLTFKEIMNQLKELSEVEDEGKRVSALFEASRLKGIFMGQKGYDKFNVDEYFHLNEKDIEDGEVSTN